MELSSPGEQGTCPSALPRAGACMPFGAPAGPGVRVPGLPVSRASAALGCARAQRSGLGCAGRLLALPRRGSCLRDVTLIGLQRAERSQPARAEK